MRQENREVEFVAEEEEFFAILLEHFDPEYYREIYPDVAQAGIDPLQHWVNDGAREGRRVSRSMVLRYGKDARSTSERNWKHYHWRGRDIAARLTRPFPPDVVAQIFNQGRHDPAVLAAGAHTIANLSPLDRENVHLDVADLRRAISHNVEFLLIVPSLSVSGDRGFATDLFAALGHAGFQSIQIVVTDQESSECFDDASNAEPFRTINVLFWRDFWVQGPEALKLVQLAQLVRVLQPRVTIVADSRHGYETVARFGRALSECTKLYCIHAETAQAGDCAARLAVRTLAFATALTDDAILADRLREQYSDLLGYGVVVLPRHLPSALVDAVAALFRRA